MNGPSPTTTAAAAAARLRAAAVAAEIGERVARNADVPVALREGGGIGEGPPVVPGLGEARGHQAAATSDVTESDEGSSLSSCTIFGW